MSEGGGERAPEPWISRAASAKFRLVAPPSNEICERRRRRARACGARRGARVRERRFSPRAHLERLQRAEVVLQLARDVNVPVGRQVAQRRQQVRVLVRGRSGRHGSRPRARRLAGTGESLAAAILQCARTRAPRHARAAEKGVERLLAKGGWGRGGPGNTLITGECAP